MKKIKKKFIAALVMTLIISSGRAPADAGDTTGADAVEKIKKALPNTKIDTIAPSHVRGLYEVTAGRNVIYVSDDGAYVIVGEIYDIKTGRNITADRILDLKPNKFSWSSLPLADAIKIGSGDKKLAIFDDPDCPYCREFHKKGLPRLLKEGVEIYIFLTPIAGLHPLAYDKSVAIWCGANREELLNKAMNGEDVIKKKVDAHCANPIDRNIQLMSSLDVKGTPTFFTTSGKRIEGFGSIDALLKAIYQPLNQPPQD